MNLDVTSAQPGSRRHSRAGPDEQTPLDGTAAVTALYAEHAPGLVRLAHIMLGSQETAEDIVQEAFLGLYRHWAHLHDQAKAVTYARSAVLNGCRSELRKRRSAELRSIDEHQPQASSAESAVLTAEERRQIIAALRLLPDRQREVLTLRFYLDLSDDQIAAALGIRQSTVRSTVHRGLDGLRRALREMS
jgi:RNA polymerase sigma-70 factor (sigma-E family)